MNGIVLAGGAATRLPNKALLPIKGNKIAIQSAIDFCVRSQCDRIIVVVPSNGIIQEVLSGELIFVEQPKPLGVGNAIKLAVECVKSDDYLVTFCDNIYDQDECFVKTNTIPMASVRKIEKPFSDELDKYVHSLWVSKRALGNDCLAGWYYLPRDSALRALPHEESIYFLNRIGASGCYIDSAFKWHDIGTVASYLHYLKG
jgi:molybdopterin-guanine dinucleotide biosynthesis protein A